MFASLFTLALLAGSIVASPLERNQRRDIKAYVSDIPIHESCTTAQRRMLQQAFK